MRNSRKALQAKLKVESLMEMTDFDKITAQRKSKLGVSKVLNDAENALSMVE
jgi:hypothetical protein